MSTSAKRSTSIDVARLAGVSRTTVSYVLNNRPGQSIPEETRRRILEAAERLEYRPHASARTLASGRSDIVLLAIPDLPVGHGISRFVEQLAAALAADDLTLVTHLAGAYTRPLPDVCATVGASAVVGLDPFDQQTVEALHRAGAAVVLPALAEGIATTEPVGRLQAQHLIDRGHRRLGYALPAHPGLAPMATDRLRGAGQACAAVSLPAPVALTTSLRAGDAATAVARWLDQGVTGVCAFNDETGLAILAGLRERGLSAPGDLAVIGADDIPAAPLAVPALSSVSFDLPDIGRRRAKAVVAALHGDDTPPEFVGTPAHIVARDSS